MEAGLSTQTEENGNSIDFSDSDVWENESFFELSSDEYDSEEDGDHSSVEETEEATLVTDEEDQDYRPETTEDNDEDVDIIDLEDSSGDDPAFVVDDKKEKPKKATRRQRRPSSKSSEARDESSNEEEDKIRCDHCPKLFKDKEVLRKHILETHTQLKEGKDYRVLDYRVECPKCKKLFLDPHDWRTHVACYNPLKYRFIDKDGKTRVQCPEEGCEATPLMKERGEHLSKVHFSDTDFLFQCLKCKKRFWNKSDVISHIQEECCHGKKPRNEPSEDTREDSKRPKTKPSEEKKVEEVSKPRDPLEGMYYKKHEYLKTCQSCKQSFTIPPQFRVHDPCFKSSLDYLTNTTAIKTGKRYRCSFCLNIFSSMGALGYHISFTHNASIDKRYECLRCRERFADRDTIIQHLGQEHEIGPKKDLYQKQDPILVKKSAKNPGVKNPEANLGKNKPTKPVKKGEEQLLSPLSKILKQPSKPIAKKKSFNISKKPVTSTVTSETAIKSLDEQKAVLASVLGQSSLPKRITYPSEQQPQGSNDTPFVFQISDDDSDVLNRRESLKSTSSELYRQQTLRVDDTPSTPLLAEEAFEAITSKGQPDDWNALVLGATAPKKKKSQSDIHSVNESNIIPQVMQDNYEADDMSISNGGLSSPLKQDHVPASTALLHVDHEMVRPGPSREEYYESRNRYESTDECFRCHQRFQYLLLMAVHDPCYGKYPGSFGLKTSDRLLSCTFKHCVFKDRNLHNLRIHVANHLINTNNYQLHPKCNCPLLLNEDPFEHYALFHTHQDQIRPSSSISTVSSFKESGELTPSPSPPDADLRHQLNLKNKTKMNVEPKMPSCSKTSTDTQNTSIQLLRHKDEQNRHRRQHLSEKLLKEDPRRHLLSSIDRQSFDSRSHERSGVSIDRNRQRSAFRKRRRSRSRSRDRRDERRQRTSRSDSQDRYRKHRQSRSPSRDKYYDRRRQSPPRKQEKSVSPIKITKPVDPRIKDIVPLKREESSPLINLLRRQKSLTPKRAEKSVDVKKEEIPLEMRKKGFCIQLPLKDPCPECHEQFSFPLSNRTHYPCFITSEFYIYDKETDKRFFQCRICPKRYSKLEDLGEHESTQHFMEEDSGFKCSICNKRYLTPRQVFKHIEFRHVQDEKTCVLDKRVVNIYDVIQKSS